MVVDGGRRKAHIYLKRGDEFRKKTYTNILVEGEGRMRKPKNGWIFDESLSTGICAGLREETTATASS